MSNGSLPSNIRCSIMILSSVSHRHERSNMKCHPKKTKLQSSANFPELRLVAWEVTRQCNLSCLHCRASAESGPYPDELSTAEGLLLLEQIREVGQPVVILTGGEPLLRPDIYELARHGHTWACGWSWPSTAPCWIRKRPGG